MTRAPDISAILADNRIKLKSQRAGHTEQVLCPKCEGGRKREVSLTVTIDQDAQGVVWKCHRGNCGWTGGQRVDAASPPRRDIERRRSPEEYTRPTPHPVLARPPALYAFFEKRGISADTVDHFGVYISKTWFPESGDHPAGEYPAITFPYRWRGELVNRKYRPPHKHPQRQDKDALPTLFNIDALAECDDDGWVVWVEGEPDVMACHEAGYRFTVTLKDGAPDKLRAEDDPAREHDKRFAALELHAEELQRFQRIVLAGDNDGPGHVLREELARRLGRHRVWLVEWPDGCKDAGDVLRQHGSERLAELIAGAQPWPIEGVQRVKSGTLLALRKKPPPMVMRTGTKATDAILRLPTEGRVVVVTGIPNAGKTSYVRYLMVHTALHYGRRWLVYSPEMSPWEQFTAQIAEVLVGKPFYARKARGIEAMTDHELTHAEGWIEKAVTMLVADNEDNPPTLAWLFDRARLAILQYGITDILIDPWNEMDHARPDKMTETEYIGLCLQRVRTFANRHGVNVWIIAHPSKMAPPKPGAAILPPGPYDIASSAHWANKPDLGITVHTPTDITEIHVWKARYQRFGRKGAKALIGFDDTCGRYFDLSTAAPIDESAPDLFGGTG